MNDETQQQLIAAALKARENAYAPYSHYAVGAALLTKEGKVFTGVNVENAVYPLGLCAERVAVFKAVSEGYRAFEAIVVATENGGSPCGACRQVLAEFEPDLKVIAINAQGEQVLNTTLRALLPVSFGPADLAVKGKQ